MPVIVFVLPIIRLDFIDKALESLYKFTDNSKFKVIVIDQSLEGYKGNWGNKVNMIIRQKNQGFAQAANTGIRIALSWGVPYIAVMNDDLEMIYPTWLEDALEEFKTDPKIIAINPECPRIALWGYGRPGGEYFELIPYKENYSSEDIRWLKQGDYLIKLQERYEIEPIDLPLREDGKREWGNKIYIPIDRIGDEKTNPNLHKPHGAFIHKRGVVDGFAGWLPIFKREGLIETGLYDERFVWGGGEDYDWMCRVYSCSWPIARDNCDPAFHKRAVSTMKSWVWHHWGKSKDESSILDSRLFEAREGWNKLDELWTPYCDPWGHTREDHKPLKRDPKVYVHIP